MKRFTPLPMWVLLSLSLLAAGAAGQQVPVPDGNTATTVATSGNISDITTATIRGINAFNSFLEFDVGQGRVVNLYFPGGAENLLNLVRNKQIDIQGILNAIKDGKIGGNVYFADPFGMVVGSGASVNVGKLVVLTPTRSFMDSFFNGPGDPSDFATTALLTGAVPISADGLINVQGKINALTDIKLAAQSVTNSGTIQSGAVFSGSSPDFSDVVNTNGLQNAVSIAVQNGNIVILAEGNFENTGTIATNGGNNLNAGNIDILAGGNVNVGSNSLISASGRGENSDGGNINIRGAGNGEVSGGALVMATGGEVSGNGGTIDFSAKGALNFAGGLLKAGAVNGTAGTVILDPTDLILGANNQPNDGTNLEFAADNSITVNPGVTISSRQIGSGTDAMNSPSTGNSGNITFEAPKITVSNDSSILANATGAYSPGDITLTADQSVSDPFVLPSISATTEINVGNATITGGKISLTADAKADADKSPNSTANAFLNDTSLGTLVGSYGIVSYKAASATSTITIGDSESPGTANITGIGDVTINSTAGSTAVSDLVGTSGFAYGNSLSSATATVASNATIAATGKLQINSASNNTLNVKESTSVDSPGVIAVAYGNASSTSKTQIDGSVSGSSVQIEAKNTNNFATAGSAKAFSTLSSGGTAYGGGAAIALGFYQSSATTNVAGDVSSSGSMTISSNSTNEEDAVFSSSAVPVDAGFGSWLGRVQGIVQNFDGYLSQNVLPNSALRTGQVGKLGVAASVSYLEGNNNAATTVSGEVSSKDKVDISSIAKDAPQITAAGSVSGQQTGLGGAVAIGNFSNTAETFVKGGAKVDSLLSTSITANATMVNPAVNRVDLIVDDQNFDGTENRIESVVKDITTGFEILGNPGEFASSFVNAGLTTQADSLGLQGDNLGLAGSVSVLGLTNKATASVTGAGTSVKAGFNPDGSINDGNVTVKADSDLTSFNVAGMAFGVGQLLPPWKPNPGVTSGSSLGGSANVVNLTNNSTAYIGDGTTVKAASTGSSNGQVKVESDSETLEVAAAQAGDKAKQFGISGTVNYLDLTDSSKAYIESDATVTATSDVDVNATNNLLDIAVGGAIGWGGKAQLDVGVNWNSINQTTLAYIGDPLNLRTSICPGCGVTSGGNLNVEANSGEHLYALTFAAAASGNSFDVPYGPVTAKQAENGAGGGYYSFGASGEIAINEAGSEESPGIVTKAFINNGANVSATGQVKTDADDSSRLVNAALAGALSGGTRVDKGAALAGAYDQNTISKDVEAFTANTQISGSGLNVEATGKNELYAVTAGGAVNATGSGLSIAGAVNNNAVYNNIKASVGNATSAENLGIDGITVSAQEGTDADGDKIVSVVGGFAVGGTTGIGASVDIGDYRNTVEASTGSSNVSTAGNIQVTANTNAEYLPIAVSFAGASTFGAAGSVAWESITDKTTSTVAGNVSAAGNLLVGSHDSSQATIIAGGAGIGGSVGVDISAVLPDFYRNTTASIADSANVSARGSDAAPISYDGQSAVGILVDARTSGGLQDYVVGGAGSKTAALGGAVIVNQPGSKSLNDTTSATIGTNAKVNESNSGAAPDQSVSLLATDNSSILDVAGMLAIGGNAGVGIGYDQIDANWSVSTSIGTGSTVQAAGNVVLDSKLQNSIQSYAIVGGASASEISGSATGATSHIDETSNVSAAENGAVNAGGSVSIAADRNTTSLDALDGNAAVAISFGAGVGVALADITTNDTVEASIGGTGDVTALGATPINAANGQLDSSGNPQTSSFQGVSVTAMSHTASNPIAAGVAGSGVFGGQGSVLTNSYTETTKAHVDTGAQVNVSGDTGANASQSVQVVATDKTDVNSIAGGASLAGLALTAAVDTEGLTRTVDASISGATVNAENNVLVNGSMLGSLTSTAVAGSAGGFAANGAVSVVNETTNTHARIDSGSTVTAKGNVDVLANRDTTLNTQDGSLAAGTALGVNGSVSTVTKNDTVSAYVDGAATSVTALGQGSGLSVPVNNGGSLGTGTVNGLTVAATAKEDLQTIAIGASATGGFSGTGSATTNNVTENTSAKIQGGATVNGSNSGAASGQGVNVLASDETILTAGDGAAGLSVGVGGIGAAIDVGNIHKTTVAGIDNGVTVQAQGAVNVDALSKETIHSYVAAVGGSIGAGLAGTTADYSTHPISPTTTAYVGSCTDSNSCSGGATVNAGSLGIGARDNLTFDVITGMLSAGGAALGAGTFEVVVEGNSSAYIGALSNVSANSGGIGVTSEFTDNLTGKALAGSGGVVSGNAAWSTTTDNSNNSAFIAGGAQATSQEALNVEATTGRTVNATTSGLSVGGLAGGASISVVQLNGTTKAYVGDSTASSTSGAINVVADLTDTSTATSNGIGGGVLSGVGSHPQATDNANTYAYVTGAALSSSGTSTIKAQANRKATSDSDSTSVGGVAVGESRAAVTIGGTTKAYLDGGAQVGSSAAPSGGLTVEARETDTGTATATPLGGGVGAGIGGKTTADINPTVSAYADGASVDVTGAMSVKASDNSTVTSKVVGKQLGAVTGGKVDAQGKISPTISASLHGGTVTAGNIAIDANGNQSLTIDGTSSASTSFVSGMSVAASGTISPTVSATVDGGAALTATNNIEVGTNSSNQLGHFYTGSFSISIGNVPFVTMSYGVPVAGVSADGSAGSFNVGSGATTDATSTITNNNSVTIGSATLTSTNGNLDVVALSNNFGGAKANTYAGGGILSIGAATSTANLTDTTTTTLQSGATLHALTGTLEVGAKSTDYASSTADNANGLSAVGDTRATGNATANGVVTTNVNSGAAARGLTTDIYARLALSGDATASSSVDTAVGGGAYATSNLNATGTPTVKVFDGATVEGINSLTLEAKASSPPTQYFDWFLLGVPAPSLSTHFPGLTSAAQTSAEAGIVPIAASTANNYSTLTALVQTDEGSALKTNNLVINSTVPSTGVYSNSANAEWTSDVLTGLRCVATLGFNCSPVTGTGDESTHGYAAFSNTINLNSTLQQTASQLADLTINLDGSYSGGFPVQGVDGNNIVLQSINGSEALPGISLNAPGGTVQGNVIANPDFAIVNNSDLNLVLQDITVGSGQTASNIAVNAAHNYLTASVSSLGLTIDNNAASDVIFGGDIVDPFGTLTVNNVGGDILSLPGAELTANSINLDAPHGSIGASSVIPCSGLGCPSAAVNGVMTGVPFNLNLVSLPANSNGNAAELPGQVSGVARGDIDLNLTPATYLDAAPGSGYSIPVKLNNLLSGGGINLTLNPGEAIWNTGTTAVAGAFEIPSGGWVGAGGPVTIAMAGTSSAAPTLNIDGALTSGFQDIAFRIDGDGSLRSRVSAGSNTSTDLINYSQAVGSSVVLSDINTSQTGITISGNGNLSGAGELATLTGATNLQITNFSNLPLVSKDIDVAQTEAPVTISLTGNVSIAPGTYSGGWGAITILSVPSVRLEGLLENPTGTTNIASLGDITGVPDQLSIESKGINFSVAGSIGSSANPLDINALAGLTAWTDKDAYITQDSGTLNVAGVNAINGNVGLTAKAGDISLGDSGSVNALNGNASLSASGDIYDVSGATTPVSAGSVNVNAGGGVSLHGAVTAVSGNAAISSGGAVTYNTINATAGNTTLSAGDSISDRTASSSIQSNGITLTAATDVTGNGSLNSASGDVQINAGRDVTYNAISGAGGTTTILAGRNISDAGPTESISTRQNLTLMAGGAITSNGSLTAVDGNAQLLAGQDVTYNTVSANAGDATMTAGNNLADVSAGSLVDSHNINMTAGGDIGLAGTLHSSSGNVSLQAGGNVALGTINADAGSVNIAATTGNVSLGVINDFSAGAGTGTTNITAGGSIVNGASGTGASINSYNVNLTAGGSVGTPAPPAGPLTLLRLNSNSGLPQAAPGLVNALANAGIYLREASGDLYVGTLSTPTANILVISDGSILNGNSSLVNMSGQNITLTALGNGGSAGSIGSSASRLVVDNNNAITGPGSASLNPASTHTLDMATAGANGGGIYVEERSGDLYSANSIQSASGDVDLLVTNGSAAMTQINVAPGPGATTASSVFNKNVIVVVQGNLLDIGTVKHPNQLSLTVTNPGGALNVAEADVFSNITARADNMAFSKVVAMNPSADPNDISRQSNGLHFNITGWGTPAGQTAISNMADNVNINVTTCSYCSTIPAVVLDNYVSDHGTVTVQQDWLETIHTVVGTDAYFATPWENVTIAYKIHQQQGASRYTPFFMFMLGDKFVTNADTNYWNSRTQTKKNYDLTQQLNVIVNDLINYSGLQGRR